jgi:RNA polymerase sigma factor (TIGR02999 family)
MQSEKFTDPTASQVTVLLHKLRQGEQSALDQLMPLVYRELHRIAKSLMRRQPAHHTLQPTALVNEAYLKLFGGCRPQFVDRAHFLAVMARVMRQVLVDHARASAAAKRGGPQSPVSWDTKVEVRAGRNSEPLKLLDLEAALKTLATLNPVLEQVIEMHYFGGMTAEESAVVLGRSAHAIRHHLRLARAWLRHELSNRMKHTQKAKQI